MNVIEMLLRHHQTIDSEDLLHGLSHISAKSSNTFSKSSRFGKFLLCVAKKFPATIPAKVHTDFVEAIVLHSTFLKKAVELELNKRTVKY